MTARRQAFALGKRRPAGFPPVRPPEPVFAEPHRCAFKGDIDAVLVPERKANLHRYVVYAGLRHVEDIISHAVRSRERNRAVADHHPVGVVVGRSVAVNVDCAERCLLCFAVASALVAVSRKFSTAGRTSESVEHLAIQAFGVGSPPS